MKGKYEANQINISSVLIFKASIFVSTSGVASKEKNDKHKDAKAQAPVQKKKTKRAKTSIVRKPSQLEDTEDENEEEVVTHLGGAEPLTPDHFTKPNARSEEVD